MDPTNVGTILGLQYPSWGDILLATGLVWAAFTWLHDRKKDRALRQEELKWKRTEFIFEQAKLFDTDEGILAGVKIVTGNDVNLPVEHLLNLSTKMDSSARGHGRHNLDKLLNLLERIATAFDQS